MMLILIYNLEECFKVVLLLIGRILNGCQKGLQNITSSYGHHEKNIEFITSGRRPRVINLIFSSDDHNYE